jgi:hypothetical protein
MTTPVNNISLLDDLPNAVGGLSAAELKARFDKAGGDIQTFLNETLIPAIEQMGVAEGTARDEAIQAAIDALELDTTVENLQKAIVAAESRAKEYANTKDAANLTAAKQYADDKAAAARSAAERTAATDATSKANAALLSAKNYANQQDAVTLLNAEVAAKNYANQQDAATLTAAKEYTDGKVPSKLPNPQKLKFTGAATGEYDGSEEKTINIPTGGGDVPAVLGNLAAQIGDAAAGTIPVYAGDEAWAIEKLIKDYTGDADLIGYIPDTAWVAAYMAAQKALLKLLPDSAAADAGKLLQVGADGNAAWGGKLPTALKNPAALTFAGAVTGTYDGSAPLTVNIPAGGSSGSGGALKAMSAVGGYIGIKAADLPENGVVWMCFGSGDSTELYTGTITIQDAGIAVNDMLVITNGTVNPLNQVSWVSDGLAIYGLSPSDYRGVYQVVGAGGGPSINWRGEYSAQTAYNRLDAVSYKGSSYVFVSATSTTGAIPGIDEEWQLLAQKGDSGESLSLGMTSAAVGQIAKISAVDANGAPTALEPVDMPSGGGEKAWTKIIDATITEATPIFEATGLNNVTELYCEWAGIKTASETAKANLNLYINDMIVASGWVDNNASTGQYRLGYSLSKYNGLVWYSVRSAGIAGNENTFNTSLGNPTRASYMLAHGVGAAEKISIKAFDVNNTPITGQIRVWAR